jgi:molybdopterin synthase sulfur carrier subunit
MIEIRYYGMLAEMANCEEEQLNWEGLTVKELKNRLSEKYPAMSSVEYAVAVNQRIAEDNEQIDASHELALLPPYAGG